MKKLFYSLMIAAATFMAACGPVEEPNGPNKPNEPQGEKPFYGFTGLYAYAGSNAYF